MTEREQWRFQWPDGTWIRWNPQTQSWEKEDQGQSASSRPAEAAPTRSTAPTDPPVRAPVPRDPSASPPGAGGWKPVAEPPAPAAAPIQESAPVREEPAPLFEPEFDEPTDATEIEEPRRVIEERPRPRKEVETEPVRAAPRRGVTEVIPPDEPDRPGGSLMPTIVAGAVVGIAVGLLLSAVIR